MPILVLCPKCHARFQVSEKFAGKQGPCPKCKAPITIPKLEDEVKVHAPEEYGGAGAKDAKGRPVLKPVARKDTKVQPVAVALIATATLMAFAAAFIAGRIGPNIIIKAVGLLIVSPPLVLAGYTFLRDLELEPYRGTAPYIRVGICSLVYAGLWGVFGYFYPESLEIWQYFLTAPLLIAGALAALATLDLDFGSGFLHYCFYVVVTLLLRLAMGLPALKATIDPAAV